VAEGAPTDLRGLLETGIRRIGTDTVFMGTMLGSWGALGHGT
jgi:hypothetical protein